MIQFPILSIEPEYEYNILQFLEELSNFTLNLMYTKVFLIDFDIKLKCELIIVTNNISNNKIIIDKKYIEYTINYKHIYTAIDTLKEKKGTINNNSDINICNLKLANEFTIEISNFSINMLDKTVKIEKDITITIKKKNVVYIFINFIIYVYYQYYQFNKKINNTITNENNTNTNENKANIFDFNISKLNKDDFKEVTYIKLKIEIQKSIETIEFNTPIFIENYNKIFKYDSDNPLNISKIDLSNIVNLSNIFDLIYKNIKFIQFEKKEYKDFENFKKLYDFLGFQNTIPLVPKPIDTYIKNDKNDRNKYLDEISSEISNEILKKKDATLSDSKLKDEKYLLEKFNTLYEIKLYIATININIFFIKIEEIFNIIYNKKLYNETYLIKNVIKENRELYTRK